MKHFKYILPALLFLFVTHSYAIDDSDFKKLIDHIHNNNFSPVEQFLGENKNKLSRDPEYYVVLLNYVLSKGKQSGIVVGKGSARDNEFVLKNKKTGKSVGFMGERTRYDTDLILDGITRTQSAQKYFKSRLDIHFGIVHIAETINKWDIVALQIITMLKTSKEINNKWIWGNINSMQGDPKEFMIENILPRTHTLFRKDTPETDRALVKISESLIQYYPDSIYGYANLGVYYLATKKYDLAEKHLTKALEIDPKDQVVLGNLEKLKTSRKKPSTKSE